MVNGCLITEDLAETADILTAPSGIHFSVLAKLAVHKIKGRLDTDDLKPVGQELNKNLTRNGFLGANKKRLNVSHYRIKDLAFMQPVAIKLGQLIFPVQLPFSKHMLFQRMVGFQYDHWSRCFKSNPAFNADNSISNVDITSDPIRACQRLQMLYGFGWMVKCFAVDLF